MDFCPAEKPLLFGYHFSSIAGAGPIVGSLEASCLTILPTIFMNATTIAVLLWLVFNLGSGYLIVGRRILNITAVLLVILAGFVAFEGMRVIGGLRKK